MEPRRLKPLQQEWTAELLGRHFLLTPPDMQQVLLGRGPHNRLGFALHLVLGRFLNFVLESLEWAPLAVVQFVSQQLEVEPAVLEAYGQRPQTEDDHIAQIRVYLGVRAYEMADGRRLRQHLVECAVRQDDAAELLDHSEAWLRREKILFPSTDVLRKLMGWARVRAEKRIYSRIAELLSEAHTTAMEALLVKPYGRRGTEFSWLNEPPRKASNKAIKELTDKLKLARTTDTSEVDLSWLTRNRARQFASLGRKYSSTALQRFAAGKRYAIMLCWLQEVQQAITDDVVTMLDALISRLFTKSEKQMQAEQTRQARSSNWCLVTMRKAIGVMLDHSVGDPQVRPAAFEEVAEKELQQAYDDSGETQRPEDYNSYDYAKKKHKNLRKFLRPALEALPFTGNQNAESVLRAMDTLQELTANRKRKLPPDTPTDFADESWRKVIQPDPETIDLSMWELCLAEKIRDGIKSADLFVVGSRQHRDWTSYIHPPETWTERRDDWFGGWHAEVDPDRYLDRLEAEMDEALHRVAAGLPENDFASVVDGKLKLSKDDKVDIPASAATLKQQIQDLLPRVKLAGMMPEVDSWIDMRGYFSHPSTPGKGHNAFLGANFFAVLVAHACNMALTSMADSADLPYSQLTYMSDWYFREECLRQAIIALVNYHHALPLAACFGPGTAAMTDGIRFGVAGNSLPPQHHPRYFGAKKGITVYDMTSDQYSHPYVQVIGCHEREGAAALDAALHHETELPLLEHMTDTHGFTEITFGLFEMESRLFLPRLRDLADQRLYPMNARQRKGPLGELFSRGRRINREFVKRNWDDMHRVGASLKDGTVTATLLVAKFQAMDRQSGIHQGFLELGRIHKTLFILRYVSDPVFRRRIHRVLNKGEALHGLGREICFARQGIFRERDLQSMVNKASCLSLIINAIVVWNTRYMMAAIDHLKRTGVEVRPEDLAFLSPLIWEHINMHGAYHFDLAGPRPSLRALRITP